MWERRWYRSDRGQVVPLMAIGIMLVAGAAMVIVVVGGVLGERTRARTAADAAALVAAVDTDAAAAEMAAANGGELIAIFRHGDQVEVEVRVGRATARARAEGVRRGRESPRSRSGPTGEYSGAAAIP